MKKLLVIAMLLASTFAFSISSDSEVMVIPGKEKIIDAYISSGAPEILLVNCSSELPVSCPSTLTTSAEKEVNLPIRVTASLQGSYTVRVRVGENEFDIKIVSSNQTEILKNSLYEYKETFTRLKEKYGDSPLIEKGLLLTESGLILYYDEDYLPINKILSELQTTLSEYYGMLSVQGVEKENAVLGGSVLPLLLLVISTVTIFFIKKRQERPREGKEKDLQKIIEADRGTENG